MFSKTRYEKYQPFNIIGEDRSGHINRLIVEYGSLTKELGKPFKIFSKYVRVFDLYFVATETSPDDKVLHGASVLYQYIDNDDRGIPDNPLVYAKLKEKKATMVMFKDFTERDNHEEFWSEMNKRSDILVQDLEAHETRPGSIAPYKFDEALEECLHLYTEGYCLAYPTVFGLKHGSAVSLMMDCARGGYFETVPKKYPDNAWYTYYAKDYPYDGFMMEYIYWAMTTILGAQKYRRCEVGHEWRPCTLDEIKVIDNPIYSLLTNPVYKLPKRLPTPALSIPLCDYKDNLPLQSETSDVNVKCCGCFGNYISKFKEKLFKRQ